MTERDQLIEIVRATPWLMRALEAVRSACIPHGCIGAGAVRTTVWDALHGRANPTPAADVDVAYFDPSAPSAESEDGYRRWLSELEPDVARDVVNQASVHLWYEQAFGVPVEPLRSVDEGVASWPETATAVALRLESSSELQVIAPCGLADLFACVVRRNARRVTAAQFRARVEAKRYGERWPRVQVLWE